MSSQQFSRHGMPAPSGGTPQISPAAANLAAVNQPLGAQGKRLTAGYLHSRLVQEVARERFDLSHPGGGEADGSRDAEQQDHPPAGGGGGGGGTAAFRDDKQETMVVRPYPQVQALGQPQAAPQTIPIQPGPPVTVAAPPVHLPQGQPAVLTEGQMKVIISLLLLAQHVLFL